MPLLVPAKTNIRITLKDNPAVSDLSIHRKWAAAPKKSRQILRIAFWQDGARLHYLIPAALKRAGMLTALYTDWYNNNSLLTRLILWAVGKIKPPVARRMQERQREGLAGVAVYDCKLLGMVLPLVRAKLGDSGWLLTQVQRRIFTALAGRGPVTRSADPLDALFGFTYYIPPEVARKCKKNGVKVILDQTIVPARQQLAEMNRNAARWPRWQHRSPVGYLQRDAADEAAILPLADHITCASENVKAGLIAFGICEERISVIPYPTDLSAFTMVDRRGRTGPITVGFCGEIGLRKGAPWFWEVAKKCREKLGDNIRFVMVGGINVTPTALVNLREHVEVVEHVPRSEIPARLAAFDIFLFPSVCEGSPSAVMEAMATGLPIVTTPTSGTVVRDGIEGFVASYDDPARLAQHVLHLAGDEGTRLAMGRAARERVMKFSVDYYSRHIAEVLRHVVVVPAEEVPNVVSDVASNRWRTRGRVGSEVMSSLGCP